MPSKKLSSGQRVILAESKTDEMKDRIKAAVIAEYERVTGEANHAGTVQARTETRDDIQQRMDALRQYLETHAREIIRQMNKLCRRLDELNETA
jgi:ribosomal protein L19E